ncbi:two-component system sensor histidine kinase YesM [Evansella vedderi]|uniref:Two-component system sensor histidine kinase YesM n=1 Tax=Evansella vedderi TaxID=38282 RepID=A0ABT9ZSB6_9BACI|nr:sensor histidine kinase [Evansella vedderi]MDQ0254113.1 two-component system sensor histidine kinase YesM [Evansella vedderi]
MNNNFHRNYFQNSYYRRLQLSFIAFILLPTLIISIASYTINKKTVIEKVEINNETVLNLIANDIEKMIDDITFSSHFIVQNDSFVQSLDYFADKNKIDSTDDLNHYNELKSIFGMTEMRTLNQDVSIFLTNNKDFVVPSFSNKVPKKELNEQWNKLKENIDYDQATFLQWLGEKSLDNDRSAFFFSRVIKSPKDNRQIGVLLIVVSEDYFTQLFQSLSTGEIALFDQGGNFLFGNKNVLLSQDKGDDIRSEKSQLSQFNWKLVYQTPESHITTELANTFYFSIFIISIFALLFIIFSLLLARKLSQPIKELQRLTTEFGSGNRDIRFHSTGDDEIQRLGKSINEMFIQINQLIADIQKEQGKKRELELNALYSQIRPHFLMNTLNSIRRNLMLEGHSYHSDKLLSLIRLLRKYLQINEYSTLINECELLEYYIDIMRMRSGVDIDFRLSISKDVEEFEFPFLTLQPIVENAIVHGFQGSTSKGLIEIDAYKEDKKLVIHIKDNGAGISEEKCEIVNDTLQMEREFQKGDNESVGLVNIYQRLYLTYGKETSVKMGSTDDKGTLVEIKIPFTKNSYGVKNIV